MNSNKMIIYVLFHTFWWKVNELSKYKLEYNTTLGF